MQKSTRIHTHTHNRLYAAVVVLLVIALGKEALGQGSRADSSFVAAARKQAVTQYEQTLEQQAPVYEGDEYIRHDSRIKVHPFYRVDSLQVGTVVYKNVQYQGVRMLFDIVRDELVVQPPNGGYRLRLQTNKIARFSLGSHQFVRIAADSAVGIPAGFYEVLYGGAVKALSRRIKTVQEDISAGYYKADYLQKDRFIVKKDGAFYEVKTKRSLLNLFSDQAKALRAYLRANRLKFNDEQREQTIARITQRYDELTP